MERPEHWDRVEEFARTVAIAPGATIRPADREGVKSVEGRALAGLAAVTSAETQSARLEVLGTLGEGGMGIVRLGRQVALGREVAIKELTDARRGDQESVVKLLQEAWLAGSLEHPNIVPVYDIELRGAGEPRIVMKRIQGAPWSELINDPEAVEERFGETDLLAWNLQVLMAVANALRFAHDRGIVHLDVKPSNVMLGAFGEVYLVDWGLGMSLEVDAGGRFPHVGENTEIIGTPAYLAPEMLSGDGLQLTPRTDVYLLGSVLCEILTGKPPHRGGSLMAILYQAATERPELPESLPEEVRAVCLRATELDPEDRYPDADSFRAAVRDFLQHRGSIALADEAERRLGELRAMIAAGPGEDIRGHWDAVHRVYTEVRFGCRQALAAWEGNDAAKRVLREGIVTMVEHVLAFGAASTAATVLSELDDPPEDLERRVDEALAREAGEAARIRKLERMGDDMDLSIGRRTRLFVLGVLGLMWTAWPILVARYGSEPQMQDRFVAPALFLFVTAGLGWYARETMSKTLVNRRLFAVIVTLLAGQVVLGAITLSHGLDLLGHTRFLFFWWGASAVYTTLLVESRLWPSASAQWAGLAVTFVQPMWTVYAIAFASAAFVVNIMIIWWPGNIRGTYDGDARLR